MTLEHQVCSLDLAKRLKELGVSQISHFYWSEHTVPATIWCVNALDSSRITPEYSREFSAFTVAELGEMIDKQARSYKTDQEWQCAASWVEMRGPHRNLPSYFSHSENADTEADARAKMLIYLLENKL